MFNRDIMEEIKSNFIFNKIKSPLFWKNMSLKNTHYINNIVNRELTNYKKTNKCKPENYNLVKNLVEILDLLCTNFSLFIEDTDLNNYNDQLCSLVFISICLEKIVELVDFNNVQFKRRIIDLLDFRNISNNIILNKKEIYNKYLGKCLTIVIEFMISINILNDNQGKEFLRISSEGFVPI